MHSTPRFPKAVPAFAGKGPEQPAPVGARTAEIQPAAGVVARVEPFRGGRSATVLIRTDLGLVEV